MKIALAQINSTVGDFEGNRKKMAEVLLKYPQADLVIFPECCLTGYPQQDLLEFSSFAEKASTEAQVLIESFPNRSFIFGSVEKNRDKGRPLRNAAFFIENGKLKATYYKRLLPSYDVFDEDRFFEAGREACVLDFKGKKIALSICEDIWNRELGGMLQNRYLQDPLEDCRGADLLINISASPFEYRKVESKQNMLSHIASTYGLPLIYVNAVGANDGIVFDGRSYFFDSLGEVLLELSAFQECVYEFDLFQPTKLSQTKLTEDQNIYEALLLGIRDYCQKTGFSEVTLGLSGGIDSALVACLASDALGADKVVSLMMPSRFTSKESNEDALAVAIALQNPLHIISIEEIYQAGLHSLEYAFQGTSVGVAEENIQSRIRGMLLMAFANKFGYLALASGNKSELAVGYCTLYGDMNGALAPLADVYKTQVYSLAREANRRAQRIPERIFQKAPSAELKFNQKDQDVLPEYELLDRILRLHLEEFKSQSEIVQTGIDEKEVQRVVRMLARSEFKRYQMPLGLKISSKAFGLGRRVPIVHRFFDQN